MFDTLPSSAETFSQWEWAQIAPYYDDLLARPLTAATVDAWLADWSALSALLDEVNVRFTIATTTNTADAESQRRYTAYLDTIDPEALAAEQRVKQTLLASGLAPTGFEVPLRKLRADAELFREANTSLIGELRKLSLAYDELSGARNVEWEGQTIPWVQLSPFLQDPARERREHAWRTLFGKLLDETDALATLWRQMITTRQQVAENAGFADYRAYRWRQLYRFDYTPDDAKQFHASIERVVVPAVRRLNERRRTALGVATLRPWDADVDLSGRPPLRPYATIDELEAKCANVFRQVAPVFADEFETMRSERLLDLESRPNKASGGYCLALNVARRPFIFANAVGTHGDVQTVLHEGGHSFHAFAMAGLPYVQQRLEQMIPMEFLEVPSTAMELLGAPYLTTQYGGFYTEAEAARARLENLRTLLTFWPYMAMVDALQHWVYEHPTESADLAQCDAQWATLVDRYWPDYDWSGVEAEKRAYWRQQSHVFQYPFYYIEYGMAQLGAIQIWANALRDQPSAVVAYRRALALGGTATLPDLYATAGARFAFDEDTLRQAVELLEAHIAELEVVAEG